MSGYENVAAPVPGHSPASCYYTLQRSSPSESDTSVSSRENSLSGADSIRSLADNKKAFIFPSFSTFGFNIDEVQFVRRIGKGAFGEVWKAVYRGDTFAVKVLKENQNRDMVTAYKHIASEVSCALPHQNVVRIFSFSTKDYEDYFLIMEYVALGSLSHLLKHDEKLRSDLGLRLLMAKQIARGMHALHSTHPPILHRDLRTANVLVDEAYTIKVADFGLSQPLQSREHREHATGRCGYIRCIPPEVFKNREFSLSSDVWAYGMLLYELLTLTQPYDGASYSDIRRFVKKNVRPNVALLEKAGVPLEIVTVIQMCWSEEPSKRPSFSRILDVMDAILGHQADEFEAAERGKLRRMQDINARFQAAPPSLSGSANLSPLLFSEDDTGKSPLVWAIIHGHEDIVAYLLSLGAQCDSLDFENKTPLHYAALNSRSGIIKLLLTHLDDPDMKDGNGMTPLHYSCLLGDTTSVGILLENGASMFTKDTRSRNAMLHACRTARHEVVSQLLCWELVHPDDVPDTGRAVSQRDKAKRTCLHYAASAGASAALIQDLIDTDAVIVNAVDKQRQSALHYAAFFGNSEAAECLFSNGANPTLSDLQGLSSVHIACFSGHIATTQLFTSLSFMSLRDVDGNTPLHIACLNGRAIVAGLLLDCGADVSAQNEQGYSPLHVAVAVGDAQLVRLLLSRGASTSQKETTEKTALHLAAYHGSLEVVQELIANQADINARDSSGSTPIHCAAFRNAVDVAKVLMQAGANPFEYCKHQNTPIHFAAMAGATECVEFLIKNGAWPNCLNSFKQTPLHAAAIGGSLEVVKLLLSFGAIRYLSDGFYKIPLAYAIEHAHDTIVSCLTSEEFH